MCRNSCKWTDFEVNENNLFVVYTKLVFITNQYEYEVDSVSSWSSFTDKLWITHTHTDILNLNYVNYSIIA